MLSRNALTDTLKSCNSSLAQILNPVRLTWLSIITPDRKAVEDSKEKKDSEDSGEYIYPLGVTEAQSHWDVLR